MAQKEYTGVTILFAELGCKRLKRKPAPSTGDIEKGACQRFQFYWEADRKDTASCWGSEEEK